MKRSLVTLIATSVTLLVTGLPASATELDEAVVPPDQNVLAVDGIIEVEPPIIVEFEVPVVSEAPPEVAADTDDDGERLSQVERKKIVADVEDLDDTIREELEASEVETLTKSALPTFGATPTANAAATGIYASYPPEHMVPIAARPAINASIAQWNQVLDTNGVGVEVEVLWIDFGNPGVLGYAGPEVLYQHPNLPTSHLYPAALTNVLLGVDANGPTRPEIRVVLNSQLYASGSWYLGTTGSPTFSQVDLMSTVSHEIAHGLGFVGSAQLNGGAPQLNTPAFAFDAMMRHDDAPLLQNPAAASAALTGDLQIKISSVEVGEVYMPNQWSTGSSYSHFEDSGAQRRALMTPSLQAGTHARNPDAWAVGVLHQMGWPVSTTAVTPTITTVTSTTDSIWVEWEGNYDRTGLPVDQYRIEVRRNGSLVKVAQVTGDRRAGGVSGLVAGQPHEVRVIPNASTGLGTPATVNINTKQGGPQAPPDTIDVPNFVRNKALDGQIFRAYYAHFLRAPDSEGFNYWLQQRAAGATLEDIFTVFGNGPEFQQRYGTLSNYQFIDLIYQNVLGRPADSQGLNFWVAQLDAGLSTRTDAMIGFVESPEFVERTTTAEPHSTLEGSTRRLYQAFFLRVPDAGGLQHWLSVAQSGTSMETIAEAFANSAEFQQRYGDLTDAQFVNLVYNNVLDREADGAGAQYWLSQLQQGVPRGEMMIGFSESAEFIRATGTIP